MNNEPFFTFNNQANPGSSKPKSLGCMSCGLDRHAKTPRMPCYGKGKIGVMIIGDCPTQIEDKQHRPFVGVAGERLRQELDDLGINMDRDCFLETACACHTGGTVPNPKQIQSCRTRLLTSIQKTKPKVLILLGKIPLDSIIGHYWKRGVDGISKWRGYAVPLHELGCWACSTFHPAYVTQEEKQESAVPVIFKRDLHSAFNLLYGPTLPPKVDIRGSVRVLDPDRAIDRIESLLTNPPELLAFDFETTGLKPHAQGHDIVCCSLCWSPNASFVFWCYRGMRKAGALRNQLKRLLESRIPKVASNLKFENAWARIILGARVRNWDHDTVVGAHVLDNRPGVTSIKFEGFVRFGVSAYDEGIEQYTQTKSKDGNAFNALEHARPKELLPYCAIDSLLAYLVAVQQKKELNRGR